jgi:hypothetical protein
MPLDMEMSAELRDMLEASDEDDREPDELHGDRPRLAVDPRSLPVRISRLKLMGRSPAHYREACKYGDGAGETLALKLGNVSDAIAFDKPVAVWNQRTASGKLSPRSKTSKAWIGFQAANAGKVIATPSEVAKATGMVEALKADPHARALLFASTVRRDVEIEWTCLGRRCVSHLDALSPVAVADLKTCETADPERFNKSALWYRYHAQLAFYVDACKAAGLGDRDAYIVAVESSAPYPVTVFQLDDDALTAGRKLYRVWLERLLACEAANEWPAYAQSVVRFTVPDEEPATLLIGGEEIEL